MFEFILIIGKLLIYWALHLFFSNYLDRRKINKCMFWVGAIIYTAIFMFLGSNSNFYINFVQSYTINFIFAIVFYNGKLIKMVVFTVIYQFIGLMADLFVGAAITAMVYTNITETLENIRLEPFVSMIINCIVLIVVFFLRSKFKDKYYIDRPRDLISMSSFSILTSIIMLTVFRVLAVSELPIVEHILILFLMPALLFSSIILFFSYDNAMKRKELEIELEMSKEMEITRDLLLEQHEKNIDEKNAIIHNFKNNIVHLTEVMDKPEIAISYCDELVDGYSKELTYYRFDVGNNVINAILGRLKYDCDQNNIKLDLQIAYNNLSFISPVDSSNLFGNLFDNAVNACRMMHQDRWINVMISISNDFVHITVSNSKTNEIVLMDNVFLSTRRGYNKKGSGIDTIKFVAKRYNGDVNIAYDSSKFTCTIWLNRRIKL